MHCSFHFVNVFNIYFTKLPYGNHTKPLCRVVLKNHGYLREIFLRRLRDVTEKTSFLRHVWDVLKTSYKRRLFWDVSETSYRRHKKNMFFEMYLRRLKDVSKKPSLVRCFWEVSEMSPWMEIWLRSLRDISCRLGHYNLRKSYW